MAPSGIRSNEFYRSRWPTNYLYPPNQTMPSFDLYSLPPFLHGPSTANSTAPFCRRVWEPVLEARDFCLGPSSLTCSVLKEHTCLKNDGYPVPFCMGLVRVGIAKGLL
jgi:hypothetical protein